MPDRAFNRYMSLPPVAVRLSNRTELEEAFHWAAEQLATHQPHTIVNGADPADFEMLRADIRAVAKHILDPLICAYGKYASDHHRLIDLEAFKGMVSDAIQGNATYELKAAGEALAMERQEERSDLSGRTWANFLKVRR